MKLNRLRSYTRAPSSCVRRVGLVLALCLLFLPAACRAHPHRVYLHWNAPAVSPVPVVHYKVYRSTDGREHQACVSCLDSPLLKDTKYTDHLVQSGRTYTYWVTSVSAAGKESGPSNTVDVTIPK